MVLSVTNPVESKPLVRGPRNLMVLLFKTIPGFHQTTPNRQNDIEEIDLLIQNASTDPFWSKESPYFLAECKNGSKPVGVDEFRSFPTSAP